MGLGSGGMEGEDGVEYLSHISRTFPPAWLLWRNERFQDRPLLITYIAGVISSAHSRPPQPVVIPDLLLHSSGWILPRSRLLTSFLLRHLAPQAFTHSLLAWCFSSR